MKIFETKQHCFDHYLQKQKSEILDYALQCFDKIKQLNSELAAAHARIAELERCVVMGGDGKPIAVGDTVWRRSKLTYDTYEFVVRSIKQLSKETIVRGTDGSAHFASECYSSPDSVTEGDKE